jgi:pimeloyl-ACP methyl ester carboxylesterase
MAQPRPEARCETQTETRIETRIEIHDGAVLHIEVDGAGPPLFLLNGAFCNLRQWDRLIPELARSFRVIRHDVRGTGRSGAGPNEGNRFEQYASDLVAIGDHLDARSGALWGMAWGARVALVAAAEHASRFTRVVLSDLAIDPADVAAQRAGAKAAAEAGERAGLQPSTLPEGWNQHDDVEAAQRTLAATTHYPDLMPFVERVELLVLIATGEHDPNLASSRRALGAFANARLEVLPHTGHGSVLQRPDLVLERVAPFLA